MTALNLQSAAARLAHLMAERPEVLAAYIFGSVVTGRTHPGSDIDVAVLLDRTFFQTLPIAYRANLTADAGAALETFDVDVVLLNAAPAALSYNIITKGKLIFERSRSARIAFQTHNLSHFLDLEPLHRLRLDYLKRRYVNGARHG